MNIFVDVGMHQGQTTDQALDPRWRFDHIYGFEPQPAAAAALRAKYARELADGRLTIIDAALSSVAGEAWLYGSNDGGGSTLFRSKRKIDPTVTCRVSTMRATDFMRQLPEDSFVVMKLNCEGAECDILQDLIDSEEIHRIGRLSIDFDIRKVRGHSRDPGRMLARLRAAGFDRYDLPEFAMVGGDGKRSLHNWLARIPEAARFCADKSALRVQPPRLSLRRRLKYWLRYL